MYIDKIGYYYLRNDYLNPQKNVRLLSKVLVKIFNVENHTFWGKDDFMKMLIPLFPNCAVGGEPQNVLCEYLSSQGLMCCTPYLLPPVQGD